MTTILDWRSRKYRGGSRWLAGGVIAVSVGLSLPAAVIVEADPIVIAVPSEDRTVGIEASSRSIAVPVTDRSVLIPNV